MISMKVNIGKKINGLEISQNNGKQKHVKATEGYLLWIICKKNHQAIGDQYRRETVK